MRSVGFRRGVWIPLAPIFVLPFKGTAVRPETVLTRISVPCANLRIMANLIAQKVSAKDRDRKKDHEHENRKTRGVCLTPRGSKYD